MKLHTVAKKQIVKTGMATIHRTTEQAAKQTITHLVEWARNRSHGNNVLSSDFEKIGGRYFIVAILHDSAGNHLIK